MTKHTPGPWKNAGTPWFGYWVYPAEAPDYCKPDQRPKIADIPSSASLNGDGIQTEANARLITEAPVMLAALKEGAEAIADAADYVKDCLDHDKPLYESKWLDSLMGAHGEMLAAIAKAEE